MESAAQDFGPEMPPMDENGNMIKESKINGMKVDDKSQSELKASIKKKGANSYYYAHNYDNSDFDNEKAKKFYGDGLIYGGEPQLIEKRETKEESKKPVNEQVTKKIAKYSWLDEESKVKIYIDLAQFPTTITKEMIDITFDDYKCSIKITDEDGTLHVLTLDKLHEKIIPDKSSFRHSEKRISITFKKWLETAWTGLLKG